MSLQSIFSFAGDIDVTAVVSPPGPVVVLGQNAVSLSQGSRSFALTVSADGTVTPGTYTLKLTFTSGSLSHLFTVSVVLTSPPSLIVPSGTQNGNAGSPLIFKVQATDTDTSKIITITVSDLPAGASFPQVSGAGNVSGIFTWTPNSNQAPGDYTVTFTANDGQHGTRTSQVTIHVSNVNRAFTLPSLGEFWYVLVAVGAAAGTVLVDLSLRRRTAKRRAALAKDA